MIDFSELTARIEAGDLDEVTARLLAADEPDRRALAGQIKQYRLQWLPQPAPVPDDWMARARQYQAHVVLEDNRFGALAVAGAGCLPRAADVVSFLRSDRLQFFRWSPRACDAVVRVLQAPGRPSIAAIAGAIATKMRPANILQWTLAGRLLHAAGLPVPPTEATLLGWMRETGFGRDDDVDRLAARLRADPRTPDLVPHIFAISRLGAALGDNGAPGLAGLSGDSDQDRRTILGGCLLRLRAGDRPSAIKPMTDLHRLLAPTVEECATNRQEYLGMLSSPHADRPALAAVLAPMLDKGQFHHVDDPMYAVVHHEPRPPRQSHGFVDSQRPPPPNKMLSARVAELARQLHDTPPPALLATPATVDGQTDPERVLTLLNAADTDGWQPGPYDLAQALLRLPRQADPAVCAAAQRLRSPAGQAFARWLRDGGLPDPQVVPMTVERQLCANHRDDGYHGTCWCLERPPLRRTVAIEAFPHPPLTVPDGLLCLPASNAYQRPTATGPSTARWRTGR